MVVQLKILGKINSIKMVKSKMTCPEWHFGEVGHRGKKTYGFFFLSKYLVKMSMISCSD